MTLDKNTKPIVHIATDEKFIKAAYDIFDVTFPGKNLFIILKYDNEGSMRYIPSDMEFISVQISDDFISLIQHEIESAKIVIFHGMNFQQAQVALSINKIGKKFIWILFGFEVYTNYYLFGREIYGKKTYLRFVYDPIIRIKDKLRGYFYLIFKKQFEPKLQAIKAFKKMDFLGILYREEYEMIKQKLGFTQNIQHLRFTYYPIGTIIQSDRISGRNIMIGNSASFSNNHIETFEIIKKHNLDDRKLIVPLSYGNAEYANKIIKEGKSIFGSHFEPLNEFMALSDYQKILQQCGVVIMNHYRQQAVGNVLNSMCMGAKVFLSEKNTLFKYLKRIGCHVFCIESELIPENITALELLTSIQQNENRTILNEELKLERICEELQMTINPILL